MLYRKFLERLQKSFYKRKLLWGGLIAAVILILGWLLYIYAQERFISPLADRLWLWYQILQTADQNSLWTTLIIIAALNIAAILLSIPMESPLREEAPPPTGRVGDWLNMLRISEQPGFVGEQLLATARNLIVEDIVSRENETNEAAWQRIRRGKLGLSEEARELVGYGQSIDPAAGRRRRTNIVPVMEEVAAYLEQKNEVKNES